MPFDIELLEDHQLVHANIWGTVDNRLFSNYISAMEALSPVPVSCRLLLVFDPETRLSLDTQVVRDSARRPPVFGPDAHRVIVATEHLTFGLSRVYITESPTSSDQYIVVRTVEEGAHHLGIDPATLPRRDQ